MLEAHRLRVSLNSRLESNKKEKKKKKFKVRGVGSRGFRVWCGVGVGFRVLSQDSGLRYCVYN